MVHPIDVFIKSFNRPYYLERCIRSIIQYLKGDYRIIVLDDGTPAIYLARIQNLFPSVKILSSPDHSVKSKAIEEHLLKIKSYAINIIPVEFWRNSVRESSDVFLLLEEDSWLTGPVELEEVQKIFEDQDVTNLKLGWNGNDSIVGGERLPLSLNYEQTIPILCIENLLIAHPLINNTLKIRSLLTKAGLIGVKFLVPYYGLYTVTSAFFRKDFWLFNWDGASETVDESRQLIRALRWRLENPTSKYGKSKAELVKTSFTTSSTNTRHSPFDMMQLNHYFNTLWMNGVLNPEENLPNDFSQEYLTALLDEIADPDCTSDSWKEWVHNFKKEYASIGCAVD